MLIYISFDHEDRASFENVRDALVVVPGLKCWDPDSVLAGSLLADTLRKAILNSDLCVFVATKRSVESAWCGAELGAFWGTGKPVLIFIAEPSLSEKDVKDHLLGHYCERRLTKLVEAVRAKLKELGEQSVPEALTPQTLKDMIDSGFERILSAQQLSSTFDQLSEMLVAGIHSDEPGLRALLSRFLGRSMAEISAYASRALRVAFTLETSTGGWQGYAQEQSLQGPYQAPYVVFQKRCILLLYDDRGRATSVAAVGSVIEGHKRGVTPTAVSGGKVDVGRQRLGDPMPDQNYED